MPSPTSAPSNVFAVFLDNLDEDTVRPWYERFYDDEIPALECDAYETEFNNPEYAQEVYDAYMLSLKTHKITQKAAFYGINCSGKEFKT